MHTETRAPTSPLPVTRADVEEAARRIGRHVRLTPVMFLEPGAFGLNARITLKLEHLQHTGSFKARGAFNAMLSKPVPPAGVIAASGGNHGAGVAFAARKLGHQAEIFVPEIAPAVKIERLKSYGALVTVAGKHFSETAAAAEARAAETGARMIHAFNQPEVMAGQGTVAREMQTQDPGLDTVLVAVGGGGLIGGMAAWFERRVRVVGVEPVDSPSLARALEAGKPVDIGGSNKSIASDSLGASRVGDRAFEVAKVYLDHVVLVDDDAIRAGVRGLWDATRLVAEPGGSAAFAALLSGAYKPAPEERVGVLICGANTDPARVLS